VKKNVVDINAISLIGIPYVLLKVKNNNGAKFAAIACVIKPR